MLFKRLPAVLLLGCALAACGAAWSGSARRGLEEEASPQSAEELARKRQREQLRSSMQVPDAEQNDIGRAPARRQLSVEERGELRRQIERQHRPGFALPDGR